MTTSAPKCLSNLSASEADDYVGLIKCGGRWHLATINPTWALAIDSASTLYHTYDRAKDVAIYRRGRLLSLLRGV